ncbi:tRNA (adenosine(37)-N6)-dimethylallyltransferase MiaA [Polyangium fumosum]|uniref:tRNA dimethylallyltransferase n=1 Tax=Polyangium fumosum TaxID=889272 RepID=A0A4U1JJJ4_9BACT|nr:tRNA (adenosine(37)-N6)-dimethylallyltransferase MiaA [Polyangium fumosum]
MRPNDHETVDARPPDENDEPNEPPRTAPSWRTIEPPREGELLVVVGPTASGKTELALRLAETFGGEIINADSVQIYRGYDVGSGKPTAEERARAPHHLVDIADPLVPLDAQTFAGLGERAIEDVKRRGRVPIVCGGTYLWIKSLVYGLAPAPPADPAIRARHAAVAEAEGRAALHAMLAAVDPESAARLAPNDLVRVSRALEIHELSGKPQSQWFAEHGFREKRHDTRLVGVAWPRETLDDRMRARVRRWLDAGWIDEVRALLGAGHAAARPMGSVGYKQVRAHLEGELPREELEDTIVRATRVFARRQRTWLRDEPVLYVALDA